MCRKAVVGKRNLNEPTFYINLSDSRERVSVPQKCECTTNSSYSELVKQDKACEKEKHLQ